MWTDAPLPPWWMDLFHLSDENLERTRARVQAAGDGGLRAVCAVLDPRFGEPPVPYASTAAREHASWMLASVARPELGPWLMETLLRNRGEDATASRLATALVACGPSCGPSACAEYARTEEGDPLRAWLADVVAHCGARTDDSLAVLVDYLRADPIHAGELLAYYGDAAGAPALLVEFDRTPSDGDDADPQTLATLGGAVLSLGGTLDAARTARFDAACALAGRLSRDQRRRMIEAEGFNEYTERPDSTDECPCRSGTAYGRCCESVEVELAERHRQRSLRPRRY